MKQKTFYLISTLLLYQVNPDDSITVYIFYLIMWLSLHHISITARFSFTYFMFSILMYSFVLYSSDEKIKSCITDQKPELRNNSQNCKDKFTLHCVSWWTLDTVVM